MNHSEVNSMSSATQTGSTPQADCPPRHSAFQQLPVVDISDLGSPTLQTRLDIAHTLDQATREAGFFYLKGHGIDPQLINELKEAAKRYFSLALDQKMAQYIGLSENHSGYVPQGEEQFYGGAIDLKEAYDVGAESPSLMARYIKGACNQWPQDTAFEAAVKPYYQAMLTLSKQLFSCFALALGLPEAFFLGQLRQPPSQLRLIHYFDNPDASEHDSGIGAHTDYEFFTILLPTAPGLQALNGSGEWIDIPLLDDCFVINIGDMMELASGGRYMATSHRVRQVKTERYAFPFFASLDYNTPVRNMVAPRIDASEMLSTSNHSDSQLCCGDHLLAQTAQTFAYLKTRVKEGRLVLPSGSKPLSSFGQLGTQPSQQEAK